MADLYTTYTLNTIEFCVPLAAELFKQYSLIPNEGLNSEQINQTYATPHNLFLKKDLALAAQQIETQKMSDKLWLTLMEQQYTIQAAIQQLQEKTRKGRIDEKTAREVEKELTQHLQKNLEMLKKIEQNNELLKTLIGKRNNMIDHHAQEWQELRAKSVETLIEVLAQNALHLSDYEKTELRKLETVPELIRKYQTINLNLPEV